MIEILRYQKIDGQEPISEWLNSLPDKMLKIRVRVRLRQVEMGNLGDCRSVGDGISELRIHIGAGYRVYFGRHGKAVVLLLCAGDKHSQSADVRQAKIFWEDWKRRQK